MKKRIQNGDYNYGLSLSQRTIIAVSTGKLLLPLSFISKQKSCQKQLNVTPFSNRLFIATAYKIHTPNGTYGLPTIKI